MATESASGKLYYFSMAEELFGTKLTIDNVWASKFNPKKWWPLGFYAVIQDSAKVYQQTPYWHMIMYWTLKGAGFQTKLIWDVMNKVFKDREWTAEELAMIESHQLKKPTTKIWSVRDQRWQAPSALETVFLDRRFPTTPEDWIRAGTRDQRTRIAKAAARNVRRYGEEHAERRERVNQRQRDLLSIGDPTARRRRAAAYRAAWRYVDSATQPARLRRTNRRGPWRPNYQ